MHCEDAPRSVFGKDEINIMFSKLLYSLVQRTNGRSNSVLSKIISNFNRRKLVSSQKLFFSLGARALANIETLFLNMDFDKSGRL